MKTKYFLVGFLAISILAFGTMVNADTYMLGVEKGDQCTYTVIEADAGYGYGSSAVLTVDSISVTASGWDVIISVAGSSNNLPLSIGNQPKTGEMPIYLCPIDVANYLKELATAYNEYVTLVTVSGTTWTYDTTASSAFYSGVDMVYTITFDATTGWATKIKLVQDGTTTLEMTGVPGGAGGIPGYELPLLLGITGIFAIGLIYITKKRV